MFALMLVHRSGQQTYVDHRVRLISEVLTSIRSVKLYAYQRHFGNKVSELRRQELEELRGSGFLRAAMAGLGTFIPILAAVCE
jgi:ATP-binding cassette subfamily C (CFTR/MRP) protein 5